MNYQNIFVAIISIPFFDIYRSFSFIINIHINESNKIKRTIIIYGIEWKLFRKINIFPINLSKSNTKALKSYLFVKQE